MTNIILAIGTVVITVALIGLQKYLSTRRQWQMGGIVPIVSIVAMIVLFFIMEVPLSIKSILPCIIIIGLQIFIWIDGRNKNRRNEFTRMKAKDI
jgi:hypothetical protein